MATIDEIQYLLEYSQSVTGKNWNYEAQLARNEVDKLTRIHNHNVKVFNYLRSLIPDIDDFNRNVMPVISNSSTDLMNKNQRIIAWILANDEIPDDVKAKVRGVKLQPEPTEKELKEQEKIRNHRDRINKRIKNIRDHLTNIADGYSVLHETTNSQPTDDNLDIWIRNLKARNLLKKGFKG